MTPPVLSYPTRRTDGSVAWVPGYQQEPIATPPPPTTGTVFGVNTIWSRGLQMSQRLGKIPMARCYFGSGTLPSDGSFFLPGGFGHTAARVDVPGVQSGKRLNMSVIFNADQITSASSPKAREIARFVQSIPEGWYVQIVPWHEYNLVKNRTGGTIAQFVSMFRILSQVIYDADNSRGRAIMVINPSADQSWSPSECPAATECAPGTELHFDIYDQPIGIGGYKAYGHSYRSISSIMTEPMHAIEERGFFAPGYGWGVDEFGSTQRVAPKLPTLDTTLGWGPLSPYDLDGSQRVKAIGDMVTFWLSQPVKPTTLLHFTYQSTGTGQWNHDWSTAGRHERGTVPTDDWSLVNGVEVRGPHYQGFPIAVDDSRMYALVKSHLDISA